jgi:ParB-like chromosome segregation protein Spo0J
MPDFKFQRNNDFASTNNSIITDKTGRKSWRDVLPIHPACAAFPDLPHDELITLGEDIRDHGLQQAIVVLREGEHPNATFQLLDGKNRLMAMELVGIDFEVVIKQTKGSARGNSQVYMGFNFPIPHAYSNLNANQVKTLVRSLNEHRRHLTAEQKRDAVAKLLKAAPQKSDRQIAKTVKASPTFVGKVRRQAEERGDVSAVDTRTDTKGRQQPARKPANPKPEAKPKTAEQIAEQQLVEQSADFGVPTDRGAAQVPFDRNPLCHAWRLASEEERAEFVKLFGDDFRRYDERAPQ